MTNLRWIGACPGLITNAFPRVVGSETGREVVGTNVGQVGKANDETEPRIAGEQIEEMETEVNVLTNEGRASLPVDAAELV